MRLISDLSVCTWKRPLLADYLPSGGTPAPRLVLDFVRDRYAVARRVVDAPIDVNRASAGTYFDASGTLQTAPADQPRIDHDPMTGAASGLLVEESRTNMVTASENFPTWGRDAVTVAADADTAPDGTLTADRIVETATTAQHRVKQIVSVTGGTRYVLSVFARSANRGLRVLAWNSGWSATAIVNLQTGAVTGASGSVLVASHAKAVGNGWYRVSLIFDATATDIMQIMFYLDNYGGSNSFLGDGESYMTLWGAQMEAGGAASSYIPTGASPVTRAGDDVSMATAGWLTAGRGTFMAEAGWNDLSNTVFNSYAVSVRQDGANILGIRAAHFTSGAPQVVVLAGGTQQAPLAQGAPQQGEPRRMAFAWAANDFAFSVDGATAVTDMSGNIPGALDTLHVGQLSGGAGQLNGHIRKLIYYPSRLSDTQLQELTA